MRIIKTTFLAEYSVSYLFRDRTYENERLPEKLINCLLYFYLIYVYFCTRLGDEVHLRFLSERKDYKSGWRKFEKIANIRDSN
jgi:hypothetical protein